MGWWPAPIVLFRGGSLTTLLISAMSAYTGHVSGFIVFLLREYLFLLFLPPSPPSIAVPAAAYFSLPHAPPSHCRTPRGRHELCRSPPSGKKYINVSQHAPLRSVTTQGSSFVAITDPAASAPSPPGTPARSTAATVLHCHLRAASPLGCHDEQPQLATGTAPPAVENGFGPGGGPCASLVRVNTPPLSLTAASISDRPQLLPRWLSRRYPSRPAMTSPSLW